MGCVYNAPRHLSPFPIKATEVKKYLLIFRRTLSSDEQVKIKTTCGAHRVSVVSSSQRNMAKLLEILSYCYDDINEYSSSIMMIETDKNTAMVILLDELSPAIILEMRDEFDGVVGKIGYVFNKYLDYESYVVELSTSSGDYKWAYQDAFDEQCPMYDDELLSDLENVVVDDRRLLSRKMREVIETFRMKGE